MQTPESVHPITGPNAFTVEQNGLPEFQVSTIEVQIHANTVQTTDSEDQNHTVHNSEPTVQSQILAVQVDTSPSQESEHSDQNAAENQNSPSSVSNNPSFGQPNTITENTTSSPVIATTTNAALRNVTQPDDTIIPVVASIFSDSPPGPSGSHVDQISEEDENVLKYFIILRPTGPAANVLAKVSTTLYCGGEQSVKDYCLNILGFNNAQYKKAFTAHERDTLEAGTTWDLFDITFLYKLLQRICGLAPPPHKKWADPDLQDVDELEHSLYLVKGERNFLAHEAVTLTDSQLQNRSQHLKTQLENILWKTGSRKNTDYSQDVTNMKLKIEEILNSSTKLSLQAYQKELEDLRQDIVNKVVTESQTELFPYYLELWSSALVWWYQVDTAVDNGDNNVPRVEQVFTNITIRDVNEAEVAINDIFGFRMSDGSFPKLIIIEGIAGIGKSHICKYILHKWASQKGGEVNLFGVEIIVFIQCHAVTSKCLREFFTEELLQKACGTLRHEDVIPAIRKCNVIFIIDGIDEAGSNARGIIKELSTKFPNCRVLITCRPEFTEEAKRLMSQNGKSIYTFYAKGFNDSQRKEFLSKLLPIVKINANDQERTLDLLYCKIQELEQHLYSLLCLPLTMLMLVLLWLDNSASLSLTTTVTRIHQQTIDMKIKQLGQRIQRRVGELRHISLIEHKCNKWLKVLSKVAWKTLMCNTQVLDENCTSELMEEAINCNIDPMDALSCFLKCTTWKKMFGTEYVWEFFHKAFQEYLSALHLSHIPGDLSHQINRDCPKPELLIPPSVNGNKEHHHEGDLSSSILNSLSLLRKDSSNSSLKSSISDSSLLSSWPNSNHRTTKRESHNKTAESKAKNCHCLSELLHCFLRCCAYKQITRSRPNHGSGFSLKDLPKADYLQNKTRGGGRRMESKGIPSFPEMRGRRSRSREMGRWSRSSSRSRGRGNPKGADDSMNSNSEISKMMDEESPYEIYHSVGSMNSNSEISKKVDDESPYEIIPANDGLLKKIQLQDTLQFLGAVEASKENVNYKYMKEILDKFNEALFSQSWLSWATFLRECGEHPVVCQLMQAILNHKDIKVWSMGIDTDENLEAVEYLLKKTKFKPGKVELWFTTEKTFPEGLGSLLCNIAEVSPSTVTTLVCGLHDSSALERCLAQLEKMDVINLTLTGGLKKRHLDDFTGLMKYLNGKDAELELVVIIDSIEDLTNFGHCCSKIPLPKRTKLELRVNCVSGEMLTPLCQVLNAYSCQKPFSFSFTHTDLGYKITDIQTLLTEALQRSFIQLRNAELLVEAYAERSLKCYEEMAFAISNGVPCAVVFEDGADGDDVTLILNGVRQS